jgi:phage-related protein
MRNQQHPDRPLYVLHGQIKSPPMSSAARMEVGYLLRRIQQGEMLTLPESRPMPEIGRDCHELCVEDAGQRLTWRVIYFIDDMAILVLEVFEKKSRATPETVKRACRERLSRYLDAKGGK